MLSWIPDVNVLAPKSLRDRIAEKLWSSPEKVDAASAVDCWLV